MRNTLSTITMLLLFVLTVTACSGGSSAAEQAVVNFLEALTMKDEALMISYTCPEYELNALLEFDAFALVKTRLDNLSCQEIDQDNGASKVSCQGSIEATYSNEQRSFDLSERTYQVIQASSAWLVCGYTK